MWCALPCAASQVCFLTVAYILAVNANIVTSTGGMCVVDGVCLTGVPPQFQTNECQVGQLWGGQPCLGSNQPEHCTLSCQTLLLRLISELFLSPRPTPFQSCITNLRASLIAATAAACVISHFLMGVIGNLPMAVCPAMGLNAYFTYTVVGFMGTGRVSFNAALAAVFIEVRWLWLRLIIGGSEQHTLSRACMGGLNPACCAAFGQAACRMHVLAGMAAACTWLLQRSCSHHMRQSALPTVCRASCEWAHGEAAARPARVWSGLERRGL